MRKSINNCFDSLGEYFIAHPKVYIYGTGDVAVDLYRILDSLNCVEVFVDSHPSKQGSVLCGKKIILPNQLPVKKNYIVIIANNNITSDAEMRKVLSYYNCTDNVFSAVHFKENLLSIFALFVYNKAFMNHLPYSITEKCTLNCEKCNHFTPFNSNPKNFELELIKQDFSTYFNLVDYVINDVVLVGGEPFLHPNFFEIADYISSNFKDKYHDLVVISNGTVIPSTGLLNLFVERKIKVTISDYRDAVQGVANKVNEVIEFMKQNGIVPSISSNLVWTDYAIGNAEICFGSSNSIEYHFNRCNYPCRYLHDGKMYFCTSDHMAQRLQIVPEDLQSFFDLSTIDLEDYNFTKKRQLMEFDYGFVNERGYLNSCASCYGGWKISERIIPVAKQFETNEGAKMK